MSRFAESGLGVEAFCRRESISTSSFYRWQSVLDDASPREVVPRVAANVPNKASTFVDLGPLRSAHAPLELHLDLGGGVLLHLVRG
jgi:hypothetical protein